MITAGAAHRWETIGCAGRTGRLSAQPCSWWYSWCC